ISRGVNVKKFGAVGNGIIDDTQSFHDAISYCLDNSLPLYIPSGLYILTSKKLYFNIDGKSFTMFGDGANTILKRKDKSVAADWERLFSFTAQNTPVEKLEIKDLMVDSNARENIPPEGSSAYVWEHCADFHIYGSKTNGGVIKNLRMDNITGVDPIADHIYIAGVSDSGVSKATFTNMFFSGRSRERGDITITGRLDSCSISNFNGQL